MATYRTIQEFKHAHPNTIEAMYFVFVSELGKIHEYICHTEAWHHEVRPLMTQYVFVNGWKSMVQTIKVF